ncbi:unnamed protein product, partial [Timema podura]|nr:unnamed protein product [Timema podura]
MGVHGLWKLVEPSGKTVPLDTLENKVLAVGILYKTTLTSVYVSIWLHQVVKGFQDSRGQALPNSHLLGLFHRVCKLLYYRIQPVFVFDGSVPQLKKQTLVARRQQKSKAEESAEKTREKLLRNLVKHKALRRVLGQKGAPLDLGGPARQPEDMFQLPPPQDTGSLAGTSSSEDEEEEEDAVDRPKVMDLHSVNVKSTEFLSLPADVRHDILTELKETRKQSSWGRLHQMPKESSDFSSYQMSRLLKRRSVQVSLEDAEKEMGGRTLSLGELGELLADQGVAVASDVSKRIASDNVTRFVYVTESPKSSPEKFKSGETSREPSDVNCSPVKKIRLEETVQEPLKTEMYVSQELRLLEEDGESSLLLDSKLQVARDFMLENSGLTQGQILSVIKHQSILGRDTSPRDALNTLESAGPSTSAFRAPSGALCDIDSDRINTDNQG